MNTLENIISGNSVNDSDYTIESILLSGLNGDPLQFEMKALESMYFATEGLITDMWKKFIKWVKEMCQKLMRFIRNIISRLRNIKEHKFSVNRKDSNKITLAKFLDMYEDELVSDLAKLNIDGKEVITASMYYNIDVSSFKMGMEKFIEALVNGNSYNVAYDGFG